MDIAYPFHMERGRTATANRDDHIKHLIWQVLFTMPGERVNRPDFGSGLMQLLFSPNSDELVSATQFLVQGSLQRWLGELIQVENVAVESSGSAIYVTVSYIIKRNRERQVTHFSYEG
jgi:phage baseplate assembly protein W